MLRLAPEVRLRIRALTLDSYTHGAVLLDARMHVIRSSMIRSEQRSTREAELLCAHHGALADIYREER